MKNITLLTYTLFCSLSVLLSKPASAAPTAQFVVPVVINPDQTITYQPTPNGDRICDYSTVGYNNGSCPLPDEPTGYQVPVLVTLSPQTGDQTDRIQAAIDYISAKPLVSGFRGSLLLKAGQWDIYSYNKITIKVSGVVIRGEGDNPFTGTRLYAKGTTSEGNSSNTLNSRLITFQGSGNAVDTSATAKTLVDSVYVPGGTNVLPIAGHNFSVNQRIQIRWPGSIAWQKASFYKVGATTDLDPAFTMNRIVTEIGLNSITLDAPITTPLDPVYGRGYIVPVTSFNNITNVGISNCYFESVYADDRDENHLWNAVLYSNVEDGFMHDCTCRYFAYSIAYVNTSTRKITINRSQYYEGISILGGGRRYSFVLTGEMALVSNTIVRYGRHSYVLNWGGGANGPNAFVDGTALYSYNESGAHAYWNNGGLWDNITIPQPGSTAASLQVKLERPAAYCVAWNCTLAQMTFEDMPLSPNWSLGCTTSATGGVVPWVNSNSTGSYAYAAPYIGKAENWSNGTKMSVRSLYENQVQARLKSLNNTYRYKANPPTRINFPPVINTPDQLVALSGSSWSYDLPVLHTHTLDTPTQPKFTVTGLPTGLTVNATTGLISGTLPTVTADTIYNLSLSASNGDGKSTKAMVLTVKPSIVSKTLLTISLEVDMNRTISIPMVPNSTTPFPVPMVPGSRLLAPMVVKKAWVSDINGAAYTAADVPVPVRANLSLEGLTSPVTITYNGSTTQPTLPGIYSIVATLDDPVYQASATGSLLITTGTAATVTLKIPTTPSASSPVSATTNQPSLTPVITYDGSSGFPATPGFYTVKGVVADSTYFGSSIALVSIGRTPASLAWGNLNFTFNGLAQTPPVITSPSGLATQVTVFGNGILPGSYQAIATITDPNIDSAPLSGTMAISNNAVGGQPSPVENWMFGGDPTNTTTPAFRSSYSRRTGLQLRSLLPNATLYPDTTDYPAFSMKVRRYRIGILIIPQACDDLKFSNSSTQTAVLSSTTVLDADFEQQTYVVVPVAGGPVPSQVFLRLLLDYSALP